jgi:hypothetical protein
LPVFWGQPQRRRRPNHQLVWRHLLYTRRTWHLRYNGVLWQILHGFTINHHTLLI